MSELHLSQLGFLHSTCRAFTKVKIRNKTTNIQRSRKTKRIELYRSKRTGRGLFST